MWQSRKKQPLFSIPSLFFAKCICSSSNEKVESNCLLLEDRLILSPVSVKTAGGKWHCTSSEAEPEETCKLSLSLFESWPAAMWKLTARTQETTLNRGELSEVNFSEMRQPPGNPRADHKHMSKTNETKINTQLKLTHIANLHSHGFNKQMLFSKWSWTCAQSYVVAWMGRESGGECMHTYTCC